MARLRKIAQVLVICIAASACQSAKPQPHVPYASLRSELEKKYGVPESEEDVLILSSELLNLLPHGAEADIAGFGMASESGTAVAVLALRGDDLSYSFSISDPSFDMRMREMERRLRESELRALTASAELNRKQWAWERSVLQSRQHAVLISRELNPLPRIATDVGTNLTLEQTMNSYCALTQTQINLANICGTQLGRAPSVAAIERMGMGPRIFQGTNMVFSSALSGLTLANDIMNYTGGSMQIMNPPTYLTERTETGWTGQGSASLARGTMRWNASWATAGPDLIDTKSFTYHHQDLGTETITVTSLTPFSNRFERYMCTAFPLGSYFDPATTTVTTVRTYNMKVTTGTAVSAYSSPLDSPYALGTGTFNAGASAFPNARLATARNPIEFAQTMGTLNSMGYTITGSPMTHGTYIFEPPTASLRISPPPRFNMNYTGTR